MTSLLLTLAPPHPRHISFLCFAFNRVAAFHLHDHHTAKVALEACQALSPEQRTLDSWIRKNEQELAKLPKPAAVTQTATPVTTADHTPVTSPVVASTPAPAPLTPAAHRVR